MLTFGAGSAVASVGFALGITSGQLSDAFLLAATGAIAVALVGGVVGVAKWLWGLNTKIDDGFRFAKQERERLESKLDEINLRVATVEHEFQTNDGGSTKDAISRIDRRSRKVAEQVGAVDYDDEEAI